MTSQQLVPATTSSSNNPANQAISPAKKYFSYPEALTGRDYIRLIEIQPSKDPTSEIVCRVINHKIATKNYDVLSYPWGNLKDLVTVSCYAWNRRVANPLMVTRNCRNALMRIRDEKTIRCLWVDAICIDQSNAQETDHKLEGMSNICYRAKRLYIYLGDSTLQNQLIKVVQRVQPLAHAFVKYLGSRPRHKALKTADSFNNLPGLSHLLFSAGNVDDLAAIFDNDWFTRAWIIQEVMFGAGTTLNDPIILVGEHKISWAFLVLLAKFCSTRIDHKNLPYINHTIIDRRLRFLAKHENTMINLGYRSEPRVPSIPLWELLVETWSTAKARMPNDKVLCLVHMSQEGEDIHKTLLIGPSRHLSLRALLQRVAAVTFIECLFDTTPPADDPRRRANVMSQSHWAKLLELYNEFGHTLLRFADQQTLEDAVPSTFSFVASKRA